jgi:hypothetical protein
MTDANNTIDWYQRRDELQEDMIFHHREGHIVKLDRQVPGDATKWYVAIWYPWSDRPSWSYQDSTIEPSDLVGDQLPDPGKRKV